MSARDPPRARPKAVPDPTRDVATVVSGVFELFVVVAMSFACVSHFSMSSSAFHLHVFQNMHPFGFLGSLHGPFRAFHTRTCPVAPLGPCFMSRRKSSRNGPRFAECPWYSTGRPPVKFRSIWRSFDAPTVNRIARNPLLFAAQHLFTQPMSPSKPPPFSPSLDHDRVGENRSSFGLS